MNLSEQEQELLICIRSLRPYERIEIMADVKGMWTEYVIMQGRKVRVTKGGGQTPQQIRSRLTDSIS